MNSFSIIQAKWEVTLTNLQTSYKSNEKKWPILYRNKHSRLAAEVGEVYFSLMTLKTYDVNFFRFYPDKLAKQLSKRDDINVILNDKSEYESTLAFWNYQLDILQKNKTNFWGFGNTKNYEKIIRDYRTILTEFYNENSPNTTAEVPKNVGINFIERIDYPLANRMAIFLKDVGLIAHQDIQPMATFLTVDKGKKTTSIDARIDIKLALNKFVYVMEKIDFLTQRQPRSSFKTQLRSSGNFTLRGRSIKQNSVSKAKKPRDKKFTDQVDQFFNSL